MKKNKIILAIFGIMLLSILFTGCTLENNSNKGADLKLEGFSHHENFGLYTGDISAISFIIQNNGNSIADNINLDINIKDNNGNENYKKEIILSSALDPNEEKVESIDVPYDLDDTQLDVNILVNWDGGTNHYNWSYEPKFKEYADVVLQSLTHYESYDLSNEYTSSVSLVLQNKGNIIADEVKIHVIVNDNSGNEIYNKEENVVPLLLPWEVKSYNITIPYEIDATQMDFLITVSWNSGENYYTRSFEPEFKENANVKLDSMRHFEHYKLFVGYMSTVTFILQNQGSTTADNVKIYIIAYDNNGNELYNSEMNVISSLIPGEIVSHEITVPINFDESRLDFSINVTWAGGSNNYFESFEPRILL